MQTQLLVFLVITIIGVVVSGVVAKYSLREQRELKAQVVEKRRKEAEGYASASREPNETSVPVQADRVPLNPFPCEGEPRPTTAEI